MRHGKWAMSSGLFAPFEELVAEGHRLFNVGADVIGLGAYFKQQIENFTVSAQTLSRDHHAGANGDRPYPSTPRDGSTRLLSTST
jgi:hypothetical protein